MTRLQCYPRDDPDTQWLYCPSYAGAIAFCVLFGMASVAHIIQAVLHRKPFSWVLIMGGLWETAGYGLRIQAVVDQHDENFATYQQLLIILAPLWINAFIYMCLGRLMHCFLPPKEDKVFGIRARVITKTFVWGDMFAFAVQLTGGLMSNADFGQKVLNAGLKIYMAGVGVQLLFILLFIGIAIRFHLTIRRAGVYSDLAADHIPLSPAGHRNHSPNTSYAALQTSPEPSTFAQESGSSRKAETLLYALYAVILLIIFRNLYRLIEFSAGLESSITTQEWYTFVFDSVPMLLAVVVFNVFHPGRFLRGARADFSEENRELKVAKRQAKRQRKEEKKSRKEEKRERKAKNKRAEREQK